MIKIKYDINIIKFISVFESITKARIKDCLDQDGKLIFVVKENEIGKAIGKKGINIKRLENALKKKIKIIEFSDDLIQFIKNCIYPSQSKDIVEGEDGIILITPVDSQTRGMLIGREAVHLRALEKIVNRFFTIKEIKVV